MSQPGCGLSLSASGVTGQGRRATPPGDAWVATIDFAAISCFPWGLSVSLVAVAPLFSWTGPMMIWGTASNCGPLASLGFWPLIPGDCGSLEDFWSCLSSLVLGWGGPQFTVALPVSPPGGGGDCRGSAVVFPYPPLGSPDGGGEPHNRGRLGWRQLILPSFLVLPWGSLFPWWL